MAQLQIVSGPTRPHLFELYIAGTQARFETDKGPISVLLNSVSREYGSGNCWLLKGYTSGNEAISGFYRSDKMTGFIKTPDPAIPPEIKIEEVKPPMVTCLGLPVPGFPVERVNPKAARQAIWVDFIVYRRTTYSSGAYVLLIKNEQGDFAIENVALQAHLL